MEAGAVIIFFCCLGILGKCASAGPLGFLVGLVFLFLLVGLPVLLYLASKQ